METHGDTTIDHFQRGGLILEQPARGQGYRVNVDAFLLADFANVRSPRHRVWDLGAGVGAVGLTLAKSGAGQVVLVERSPWFALLAEKNIVANGLAATASVLTLDVLEAANAHLGDADLVVSNPPYFVAGRTRPSPTVGVREARSGDVTTFIQAARKLLSSRGRACFVYPASELLSFLGSLRKGGLEPKRMRLVHAKPDAPARVVLVEAQPAKAGGLHIDPALIESDAYNGTTPPTAPA